MSICLLGWEHSDGTPVPFEEQPESYKQLCNQKKDPDNDGEDECLTPIQARWPRINYKEMDARMAAV
jgi:hypothetical protein